MFKVARFAPLLLLLAACKPKAMPTPIADASPDASGGAPLDEFAKMDGEAIYTKLCVVCHKADRTGYGADNAPSLATQSFLESVTDEQLRRSIGQGRPGTAMAGYDKEVGGPLDAIALSKLSFFLRSKGGPPVMLPPTPGGDPKRGEALYHEHCESCHGTAETRGTAVHLMNPKFLEHASDAFLKWAIVKGRAPTPMPAWLGKLQDTQIDDLVSHLRTFDKTPHVTLLPAPTGKEPIVTNPSGKHPVFKLRADACGPDPKCVPDPRYVSAEQVKQALEEKKRIVLIDARPPSDWMRVHVPGAIPIPYHDMARLTEIPNDGTWVVAYCACPHHLSGDIVNELRKRGYKHAVVLDEGILEWHRRGYPVVAGQGVVPPPKIAPMPAPVLGTAATSMPVPGTSATPQKP